MQVMAYTSASMLVLLASLAACDDRRPIYNIAHMVNSIEEIEEYLDTGANVLEFDIQFYANGSVDRVFHGIPCDLGRDCERSADLKEYLEHLRNITDPSTTPKNYADQMVMQFFDCKVSSRTNNSRAGEELAKMVMDNLWDGKRKQEIRVLIYIDSVDYNATIVGFVGEFKRRGRESRLVDVGFDGGSGKVHDIGLMFDRLGVTDNIWIGDGAPNYAVDFRLDVRLEEEIEKRDNPPTFIRKVYHWTIDSAERMMDSLKLGVDGFITNKPSVLTQLLRCPLQSNTSRLATPDDDPFERFVRN